MPNFFKLDTNIDGNYVDSNGNPQIIKDFIQVVSGVDGSSTMPNDKGVVEFSDEVSDVAQYVSISGHGIVYDETGIPVARKGNLVIKDVNNKFISTYDLYLKTVREDKNLSVIFKDQSLTTLLNKPNSYLTLDNLIANVKKNKTGMGNGNITQLLNKTEYKSSEMFIDTTNISTDNKIIISCKVITDHSCTIGLYDSVQGIAGKTLLTSEYILNNNESRTAYVSFVGQLGQINPTPDNAEDEVISNDKYDEVNKIVYNNFYKKHFYKQTDTTEKIFQKHRLILNIDNGTFINASMNIIVSESVPYSMIQRGIFKVNKSTQAKIDFDQSFPDNTYCISFNTDSLVRGWYTTKTSTGFLLNFENTFSGDVHWTATHNIIKG